LTDQLPPPGWHPDPHDPSRWRWWDGQAWTDQVSAGQASQSDGTLWRAATLWVDSRARVGSWEADVRDESGRPAGSVRGGLEMVLADAARAPQLRLRAERDRFGVGHNREALGRVHVSDGSGAPLGALEVVKYFNSRVTLSLRGADSEELAVLSPEAKNDKEFSIADPAGAAVGRVVATESKSSLLSQDRTWWVSLARPLAQPLDSLALGAATTLSNIQMMVVNWHDTRFDD
jgi:Protein of unknown function (DUF2510)